MRISCIKAKAIVLCSILSVTIWGIGCAKETPKGNGGTASGAALPRAEVPEAGSTTGGGGDDTAAGDQSGEKGNSEAIETEKNAGDSD